MTKKTLTKRSILSQLIKDSPDFPQPVIKTAMEIIIQSIQQSLAQGRTVTLRGFGSLIPRRYPEGPKKLGLLFHPSPVLTDRVNERQMAEQTLPGKPPKS
ncbi:MAG: HU family DNA-binding protein [Deltaproteobacteria bacterium]|jgi:hypothetical protein|nr:HU family DNA-binding protein [Deltaproteobacteria bacterium]